MRIVWDPAKSAENARKHGLTFTVAAKVFQDRQRFEVYDIDHSDVEDRWTVVGFIGSVGYVVRVTCADADPSLIRIVSARRAGPSLVNEYITRAGHHD